MPEARRVGSLPLTIVAAAWRLSITMEAAFCVETLGDALARHGKPDIFNADQGSQFAGPGLHRRAR
jgi:transposase InsO family protein